jgi:hypothetical protein
MSVIYINSVTFDFTELKGKTFKMATEVFRAALKNRFGFKGLKGIKDDRLKERRVSIRVKSPRDQKRLIALLNRVMNPQILDKIMVTRTKPKKPTLRVIHFHKSHSKKSGTRKAG